MARGPRVSDLHCPAAGADHGISSHNELDVRCGVSGMLRAAEGSPCVASYWNCSVWRREKDRLEANKRARAAVRMQRSDGMGYEAA